MSAVVCPSSGGMPTMALGLKIVDHRLIMVTGEDDSLVLLQISIQPTPPES